MADDPGQRHPQVAVEELLVGRPGGRVVVDAGALHLGAKALRRRVVQGEEQAVAGADLFQQQA